MFKQITALLAVLVSFIAYIYIYSKGNAVPTRKLPPNPVQPLPPSHTPLQTFPQAAICSDHQECSELASAILKQGGSVVDGSLAALLCSGLLGMQSMGLGGGLLMNIYLQAEHKSFSLLGREVAPLAVKADNFSRFHSEQQLKQSGWSIAVPTELQAYALAHQRFGHLPWRQLVQPTVELCHQGWPLYKHQSDALMLNQQMIQQDSLLSAMFINPKTLKFWTLGSRIQPPAQLCRTYQRLAEEGPLSLYNGSLKADFLADLNDLGSSIQEADLQQVQAELRESLVLPLDEYQLHVTPPPGSGLILGFIMQILKEFRSDFAQADRLKARDIHRIIEALKFGFVKRWQLEDGKNQQLLDELISLDLATLLAKQIDDTQTFNSSFHYGARSPISGRHEYGTSHISVIHKGDAVSVTSSLNFYFGSGRMGKRTGILFNNAMSDFSLEQVNNYFDLPFIPGKNIIAPQRRPMSSMSPLLVTERSTGQLRLAVGAAGGTKIISALVPLLVRILWQGKDIKYAIDAYRVHHQMLPNVLLHEYGLLQSEVESLTARGHLCERYLNRGSVICGIERQSNGSLAVNTDYRKMGGVAGF